jgi:hypothetical protein
MPSLEDGLLGSRLIGQVVVGSVVGSGPVSLQYHGTEICVVPLVAVDGVTRDERATLCEILLQPEPHLHNGMHVVVRHFDGCIEPLGAWNDAVQQTSSPPHRDPNVGLGLSTWYNAGDRGDLPGCSE